jgi:pyruvate kinase
MLERSDRTLVVTLGPASLHLAGELVGAGATGLRLNASHMTAAEARAAVDGARSEGRTTPVIVDLQGAKMRLGRFVERRIAQGERVSLAWGEGPADALPVAHVELFEQARPGETLSVDDDRLRFEVASVSGRRLDLRALTGGVLRSRKGVNVVEHPVVLADLVAADVEVLEALSGAREIAWAVSFMADGREAAWVRRRLPAARVIGKIERREAIRNLAAIAAATDEVWICRGDLGAQVGAPELARFVGGLDPRSLARPVLMAGQVLEHLTAHSEPTRSEVCHLHDLLARGYAGVVLSDETAVGQDPLRATRIAAELLKSLAR